MNIIKTTLALIFILTAVTACNDKNETPKSTAVDSELNNAVKDLKSAAEHTKNATVSTANNIKKDAIKTVDTVKNSVESAASKTKKATVDAAKYSNKQIQKAKAYSAKVLKNTAQTLENSTPSEANEDTN